MRRWWPMSLESQTHALLLKLLPPTSLQKGVGVPLASVCHTSSPQLFCVQQLLCQDRSWRHLIGGLLPLVFSGIGSPGKTSLAAKASWHLGFAICLPAPKVSDCLLALTFLLQYCITGERAVEKVTLVPCVPSVYCSQGWLLHSQWSSNLPCFCFVSLFDKRK